MARAPLMRSFNVRALLAALTELDFDVHAICAATGIPSEVHTDPDVFVSNESIAALWMEAAQRHAGPHLGLAAGRAVPFGAYEVIDYLAASAKTIGEGMTEMARYFALIHTGLEFHIDDADAEVSVTLDAGQPLSTVAPVAIEYTWAVVVCRFVAVGNAAFRPRELSIPYAPADPQAFDFVAERIVTRPEESVLRIPRAMWELPQDRRDDRLREVLERHAQLLFEKLPTADEDELGRVRRAIVLELRAGNPGIDSVAPRLGMSARTLQRRLKAAGRVYQELVDAERQRLARGYLRSSRLSVADVAYMLGYSEPSAFNRAFKRWTGTTPHRFRTDT